MSVHDLLTGLANSVRLKTSKTGKMNLEQIADAINGITVEGDVGYTCGSFTASTTGSAKVISHGLKQVPGAVLFAKKGSPEYSAPSSYSSFNEPLLMIVCGKETGNIRCSSSISRSSSGSTTSSRNWGVTLNSVPTYTFGSGASANPTYVTNINATNFTTPKNLVKGDTYIWIAFRAALP